MRIGIDIDGICYKWEPTARFLLEWYQGYVLPVSRGWNSIKEKISPEAWRWLWTTGVTKYGLFRHGHPYRGTVETLQSLGEKEDLVFITSRPKAAKKDTVEWLGFHQIPVTGLYILGPGSKKSTVPCDIYLDDNLDNCAELRENTDKRVICWTRPWNWPGPKDLERVSSWSEFMDKIKEMA